jgi:hypothetical protein
MCRHLGAGDQEGECWDEMMGTDAEWALRDVGMPISWHANSPRMR